MRRTRLVLLSTLLAGLSGQAVRSEPRSPPNPVPRPLEAAQVEAARTPDCLARLRAAGHGAEAAQVPPPKDTACFITDPVRLATLAGSGGAPIVVPDQPLLACDTVERFAGLITDIGKPLAEDILKTRIVSISTGPGHDCRPRNRRSGAKISAHGAGRAIDIAVIRFADKREIAVRALPPSPEQRWLNAVRKSACGWFTTVLGPGADSAHADHLHLDAEPRSHGMRMCQ